MASSLLEDVRIKFEEIELIEKGITKTFFQKANNPRESVMVDHKIKNLIDMVQKRSVDILIHYNGKDDLRRDELAILKGQKNTNPSDMRIADVWNNFYDRLKDIKDYHKKHPNLGYDTKTEDWFLNTVFEPPYSAPTFSAEENNGKYVDMTANFQDFLNIHKLRKSGEYKIGDYLWYLGNFDQFHEIPVSFKEKEYRKYKRYLKNVYEYLKEFFRKTQPLTDLATVESKIAQDFEDRWKEGTVRGWERKEDHQDNFESNPLYCVACQKLFTNHHVFVHHQIGKKHKKNAEILGDQIQVISRTGRNLPKEPSTEMMQNRNEELEKEKERRKKLASLESGIIRMKDLLNDIIYDTMNQIRKKQSRTYAEMEAEAQQPANEEEKSVAESDEDDDAPVYNPKNLPLGWDGKPIPYWLYKLHGLGIEYKCEICGNYSYWGRRAFERHFQEWRHSYGMKCLRIPNTVHFKEITSINDALALHSKLMLDSQLTRFKPEEEEEFEDTDGNILNKKEHADLKRQGLL